MKRILLFIVLVTSTIMSYGDDNKFQAPDYKTIKKDISDKTSELYYPKLMERYNNGDTTLTLQECRALYYGFLYQHGYSVYGSSDYTDSVRTILQKEELSDDDFYNVIRYEKLILEQFPFNLRDLNLLANMYYTVGDSTSTVITDFKIGMLVEAILSTGNGEKEETAWHVISVSHEYDLLNILGFQFGGSQSLTRKGCDYLKVAPNKYDIKGLYFDVNEILNKQKELFK